MHLNNFSVRLTPGRETESGYHELHHGQTYRLHLKNGRSQPCDAEVHIDGKLIGCWRIEANSKVELERPSNEAKLLTFYLRESDEANAAQLDEVEKDELGLIRVVFKPGKVRPQYYFPSIWPTVPVQPVDRNDRPWKSRDTWYYTTFDIDNTGPTNSTIHTASLTSSCLRSAGGTGMSGHSSQQFTWTDPLDYDADLETTIHLRLVGVPGQRVSVSPLMPVVRSTPIPPPVLV